MENESTSDSNLVDCSSAAFKSDYEMDGFHLYAFFAPELFYDDDGLDATGLYQITLLHPTGQYLFTMYPSDGFWKIDEEKPYITERIGPETIQWLGDEIDSHNP